MMSISMGRIRMNAFIELNEIIHFCNQEVKKLEKKLHETKVNRIVAGHDGPSYQEKYLQQELDKTTKVRGGLKYLRFRLKIQMEKKNASKPYS